MTVFLKGNADTAFLLSIYSWHKLTQKEKRTGERSPSLIKYQEDVRFFFPSLKWILDEMEKRRLIS